MSKFDVYRRDITGNLNENITIQNALEDFKNTVVTNKPLLIEIQNHLGGRALAVGIQSDSDYNSFLVITYYDRPKEFVYAMNHWEVYELVTKSDLANKTKSGSATISTKQNDSTALQIQFDEPFPSRPYVTVSLNADNANTNTKISVFGIDQTGFKVSIYDTAITTRRIEWIASV